MENWNFGVNLFVLVVVVVVVGRTSCLYENKKKKKRNGNRTKKNARHRMNKFNKNGDTQMMWISALITSLLPKIIIFTFFLKISIRRLSVVFFSFVLTIGVSLYFCRVVVKEEEVVEFGHRFAIATAQLSHWNLFSTNSFVNLQTSQNKAENGFDYKKTKG